MGFDGKYLGINGQGMTNPIQVEEIPRCTSLGYEKKMLENSPGQLKQKKLQEQSLIHYINYLYKDMDNHSMIMQGYGKPLHDSENECNSESRKVHPFNCEKIIKED